jgi:hypothetical protein
VSSASAVHCGLAACCFSTGRPHCLSHLTHAHQQHVGRLLIFSIHSWWVFISFPLHCSASTIFAIGVSLSHLLQGLLILLGLNLPEAFGPRAQHATDPYPSVWQLARLQQDPGIQLATVTEHMYLLWQATYSSEYVARHCVLQYHVLLNVLFSTGQYASWLEVFMLMKAKLQLPHPHSNPHSHAHAHPNAPLPTSAATALLTRTASSFADSSSLASSIIEAACACYQHIAIVALSSQPARYVPQWPGSRSSRYTL